MISREAVVWSSIAVADRHALPCRLKELNLAPQQTGGGPRGVGLADISPPAWHRWATKSIEAAYFCGSVARPEWEGCFTARHHLVTQHSHVETGQEIKHAVDLTGRTKRLWGHVKWKWAGGSLYPVKLIKEHLGKNGTRASLTWAAWGTNSFFGLEHVAFFSPFLFRFKFTKSRQVGGKYINNLFTPTSLRNKWTWGCRSLSIIVWNVFSHLVQGNTLHCNSLHCSVLWNSFRWQQAGRRASR